MTLRRVLAHLALVTATLVHPNASAESERAASEEFATMRDGVRLAANVYRPSRGGPWPVILTRTPYLKDNRMFTPLSAKRYTDAGYVFVLQDVRGKGHSEGEYVPFANDRYDGYDTVEWAAKQPWSNGKVGMSGTSAMGITANLAASTNPPSLKAAYVVVAPQSRFYEHSYPGGVFKRADSLGWRRGQNADTDVARLRARAIWSSDRESSVFRSHIDQVHIPIYNVGGWYDIFSVGTVRNMYLQHQGADGARGNQKLMMGPFGHGDLQGDLEYPEGEGLAGAFREELRWFDHWL
ncbi:MAG: CocE/NonD family hydrolase, partial [Gammaproteobacteria bacterium]